MGTELRITLPGPEGSADAQRAFKVLSKIADMLAVLDRVRGRQGRTTWEISRLGRGSVEATLSVGRPRPGLTEAEAAQELKTLFDGFAAAQDSAALPVWPNRALKLGAEISRLLGQVPSEGMQLGLVDDGGEARTVAVTRRAGEQLSAALRSRRTSIGSLVGMLEEINTHDGRNTARLFLRHPRVFVEVAFRDAHLAAVRDALTRRVMVGGLLERSPAGEPLRIQLRNLTVLPSLAESPSLSSFAGADPDFTGGVDPVEYVRNLRDTA